jgi:hypothetical protein
MSARSHPLQPSAGLRDVRPHGLHDEDVGQPAHDGLEARLARRHLRRDELQVRLEPPDGRSRVAFDVQHGGQRGEEEVLRAVLGREETGDERRHGAASAVPNDPGRLGVFFCPIAAAEDLLDRKCGRRRRVLDRVSVALRQEDEVPAAEVIPDPMTRLM